VDIEWVVEAGIYPVVATTPLWAGYTVTTATTGHRCPAPPPQFGLGHQDLHKSVAFSEICEQYVNPKVLDMI